MKILVRDRAVEVRTLKESIGDPRVGRLLRDLESEGLVALDGGRASLPS